MVTSVYQQGGYGTTPGPVQTVISPRAPTTSDKIAADGSPYQVATQYWQNTTNNNLYQYAGNGVWNLVSEATGGPIDTLTGNTGGAIGPTAGNINIVGATNISVTGSGSTLTISDTSGGFPITPFVVGPVGQAGYQTIASAITAASLAGGGLVYIQPGSYTESLTLVDNVFLQGASPNDVTITGVHTPPASGTFYATGIKFVSATHVLSSAAAGTTTIVLFNCLFTITTGYVFSLLNWTGNLQMYDCGDVGSTTSGVVNNTGGSAITLQSVTLGAGTANAMVTSGTVTLGNAYFLCPWSPTTGTVIAAANVGFSRTTIFGGNTTGSIRGSFWYTGSTQAITMSSSAAIDITDTAINTSNAPAIGGAGAGVLTLAGVQFLSNATVAATVTKSISGTAAGSFTPYTVGIAGNAAYQTIAAAITAATATGGVVYIQPGTYTENLTLVSNVTLLGASNNTTIITGVHTPPATGTLYFNNIKFTSATDILNSAAAGSTAITFDDCLFTVTTGYTMNLLNWTGPLTMFICGESGSTTNGIISNTGGSACTLQSVTIGAGTGNAMVTSGVVTLGNAYFLCPWSPTTGTVIAAANIGFTQTTIFGGNTSGAIRGAFWETGSATAITMSSSGNVDLTDVYINTSNATAIGGAGAGILSMGVTTFKQSDVVAATLTLSPMGLYTPLTVVGAGATPRTCNSRAGTVTFSSVSIAAGATQSLVISNTAVPSNSSRALITMSGATSGAALTIQSITASAGTSLTIVVANGTGATTTTANITFDFILLN